MRTHIVFNDEDLGEPPGMESVTIALHMAPEKVRYGMQEHEFLPILLPALGLVTKDPMLPVEQQGLVEVARQQIINAWLTGGELPPMRLMIDQDNKQNAVLRCHLYIPRVVTEWTRRADQCKQGITLANEVAAHRW